MTDPSPKEIADAFYSSYLARDFFAKVIPGGIVILALLEPLYASGLDWDKFEHVPILVWFLMYGICWIIGFTVQAIGEITGFFRANPRCEEQGADIQRGVKFNASQPTEMDRVQRERFAVVKEATGNTCVAASLALLIIVLFPLAHPELQPHFYALLTVLGIAALSYYHKLHQCRQRNHEIEVINKVESIESHSEEEY